MDNGGRQHLINKANRGRKQSGSKGDNKGRNAKLRAACPVCPPPSGGKDNSLFVGVGSQSKTAKCRNGHIFRVGAGCIPGDQSYLLNEA